jgi:hypothetical protein
MRRLFYRRRFIFIPIVVVAVLALAGFVVMNLWNWLIPAIFHLGVITFWQALGIFVLCKILFGHKGHRMHRSGPWMRQRMEERFRNMSSEEKEKFKEKMKRHRCNWDRYGDDTRHPFDTTWENDAPAAEKAE